MSVRPWLDGLRLRLKNRCPGRRNGNQALRRLQSANRNSSPVMHRQAEILQDRTLLTAQVLLLGSELQILTDADEDITVQEDPGNAGFVQVLINSAVADSQPTVAGSSLTQLTIVAGDSDNTIDVSGVTAAVFPNLTGISIVANDGHDVITGSDDFADSIEGGDGDDTINGQGGDSIVGAGGGDTILGGDGNDSVLGGDGDDSIDAGDGDDEVIGGAGDDTILGDDGSDTLSGNDGNDSIFGGHGDDSLSGEAGTDFLQGDLGDDIIVGGTEADTVFGGGGADFVDGGDGDDSLFGNSGGDTINGQAGNDVINVGNGSDSVVGGDGNDLVTGGLGNDTIDGSDGDDTLNGGGGNDLIYGDTDSVLNQFFGNDLILGQFGDDTLIGTLGMDTIIGGLGDDLIQSTIDLSNDPPPPPPVPPTPPPQPPGVVSSPFDDAVAPTGMMPLGSSAVLSTGMGDFSLNVTVDGDGTPSNVTFDPFGTVDQTSNVVFAPEVFRIAIDGGALQTLNSGGAALTGDGTGAVSTFTQAGLTFTLTQQVEPFNNNLTNSQGSMLTQTYEVTNPGATQITFDISRTTHYHTGFPGGFNEGAGRFFDQGVEILAQTQNVSLPTTLGNTVAITSLTGVPLTSNRFEINVSPNGFAPPFNDTVFDDPDGDGFTNSQGHVGMGLRSQYIIPAGGTITHTQHLIVASANFQPPNIPPVASPDSATTFGSGAVTIDLVSNDTDSDGVPVFTSVNIVTQPANGTVVNLGNGLVQYTPNAGFAGTDSFTYNLMDDDGDVSNTASVTVTVQAGDLAGDFLDGSQGQDTVIGSGGNDLIIGGLDGDNLQGGEGNDSMLGGGGDDTIDGQAGEDTLFGQGGHDSLLGGDGNDELVWRGDIDGNDTLDGQNNGNIGIVRGDSGADTFSVGQDSDGNLTVTEGVFTATFINTANVRIDGNNGNDTITIGDISSAGLIALTINGGTGDDVINGSSGALVSTQLTINGGEGQDTITGTMNSEVINGDTDNDSLIGGGGNDTISGGDGDDAINGEAGDDSIDGGAGNDFVRGGDGNDSITGGADQDTLDGEDGNDTLLGGFGDDNLNGNRGDDSLLGGLGRDVLIGAAGNDVLDGGRNDDTLRGNSGNDKLRGDHGNDLLVGLNGDDELNGGDGNDTLFAGTGDDGLSGGDGDDFLQGDQGDDVIVGGDGNDNIVGGAGKDTLLGQQGDDTLNGNGGTDTGNSGEGANAPENSVEIIDVNFQLSSALLDRIDGVCPEA